MFGGMPGTGKSTTAYLLAEHLPQSFLISSKEIRARLRLDNLLSDVGRALLIEEVARIINTSLSNDCLSLIIDTNLIDTPMRTKIVEAVERRGFIPVYFHMIADEQEVLRRTTQKYGIDPFFTHDKLSERDIIQFVQSRTTPFDSYERAHIKVFIQYDTFHNYVEYDVADVRLLRITETLFRIINQAFPLVALKRIQFFF